MTLEHDAVRETLIGATLALMDEGGLEAVKARPLAKAVGVSVGTIYNLFGSVDGLVMAANMRIYADLGCMVRDAVPQTEQEIARRIAAGELADIATDRVRERLLGLAGTYIDFVAANAQRWSGVIAFDRRGSASETPDGYESQLETLIGVVAGVLGELPGCRETERAQLMARALWSAVYGIVSIAYFSGDEATARQRTWDQIAFLVGATVAGLGAEVAPGKDR
jgi:AcrR family transcriptional regulator